MLRYFAVFSFSTFVIALIDYVVFANLYQENSDFIERVISGDRFDTAINLRHLERIRLFATLEDISTAVLLVLGFQFTGAVRSLRAYLLTLPTWVSAIIIGHLLIGVDPIDSESHRLFAISVVSATLVLIAQKLHEKFVQNQQS